MNIKTIWRGDAGLPMTYWIFGVVGTALLGIPLSLVKPGSAPAIIAVAFFSAYVVWVSVSIWRAADKYRGPKIWSFFPKLFVTLPVVGLVIGIGAAIFSSIEKKEQENGAVVAKVGPSVPINTPYAPSKASSPAVLQNSWVRVDTSKNGSSKAYIDPSTIRSDGNLRRYWKLIDFDSPTDLPFSPQTKSIAFLQQIDCVQEKSQLLHSRSYGQNMGEGMVQHSRDWDEKWDYIAPNTWNMTFLNLVCAR